MTRYLAVVFGSRYLLSKLIVVWDPQSAFVIEEAFFFGDSLFELFVGAYLLDLLLVVLVFYGECLYFLKERGSEFFDT